MKLNGNDQLNFNWNEGSKPMDFSTK